METVIQVLPREDFHLELTFNTGEKKLFDARPYLERGVFKRLKDVAAFRQAYVAFDTVCWPEGLDIAPETLYDRSILLEASSPQDKAGCLSRLSQSPSNFETKRELAWNGVVDESRGF